MRIVVTGSSSGIGRALAGRLLDRGHRVWGVARSSQADFAALRGASFRWAAADVADFDALARLASEVGDAWGGIDGIVCAAGVLGAVGPGLEADPRAWVATVRTNLEGTYFTLRAFHRLLLRAERRAKAVCFSGGGSTKSRPRFSAYGVAKTGIVRLVETLADETAGQAFDINAIAPGAIATRMTEDVLRAGPGAAGDAEVASARAQLTAGHPPMENALGLVEWLLSDASDGIRGRLLSAPWDPWRTLDQRSQALAKSDIFQLRRIVPQDRGQHWDEPAPP
jgi:NAD(P)-dependent dehydrogenase (short-subunit alcohol dehydrogenase family)